VAKEIDQAQCTQSATGCDCQVSDTDESWSAERYRVEGSRIVTDTGKSLDYCVRDGQLLYREVGPNVRQPGVFALSPS
jgi:hypothetical protein